MKIVELIGTFYLWAFSNEQLFYILSIFLLFHLTPHLAVAVKHFMGECHFLKKTCNKCGALQCTNIIFSRQIWFHFLHFQHFNYFSRVLVIILNIEEETRMGLFC